MTVKLSARAQAIIDRLEVEDAERRVEYGRGGVGTEQGSAEGVDRADACRIEASQDAQPMFDDIGFALLQSLLTGRADPVSHFSGGAIRKRDGHHRSKVGGDGSRFQPVEKSLSQHERLAAAGPGGKRDRHAAGLDGRSLLIGIFGPGWRGHLKCDT